MPIFNFRCEHCGKHFERIIKHDELEEQECPECRSHNLIKLISNFGSYTIKGNNTASTRPKGGGGKKI